MSTNKVVTMIGSFTDAAGQTHESLDVKRGTVFYNADNTNHVAVTVVTDEAQVSYTAPHDDTVYASLIQAHANYAELVVA